ncbi:hypothetical protein COL26b_007120 [Colletotrichum chrysophilum]|uniref:uncharacterized protein n=1 Tax=Colletotrichum chrysophilum TaxID=1836956 RepID=UPI0023009069|nr:uncharacterized protein COL26b_007120 [Colletotrichum chrysophilum]KAJ0374652.1 hypothetical protein COL26b_007120 [Colletotrichum chrysophilum]
MASNDNWRTGAKGIRPVRIANCSGYHGDPPREMYKQATLGDVDFITGDYLAEVNMANNAEAYAQAKHNGYEETAWEGLLQAIDVIADKRIKVAINGGALNAGGLALKVADLHVTLTSESFMFTKKDREPREIVSANAYLGAHAIYEALQKGADIVICGRASDASPVIACAWYWWSWNNTSYDEIAGALVAGHLIECSAYVTGGNFSGFENFDLDHFVNPGFPIAEISKDGTCIITKHAGTGGMVTVDTCRSQLLYELQGNAYLNSDVKAYLNDVVMEQVEENRIHVSGIRGAPPPDTTKLAVFYKGGYELQALFNATGHSYERKAALFEKQIRALIGDTTLKDFDVLEFQRIGVPATNPMNQNSNTIYIRVFAQSTKADALNAINRARGLEERFHFVNPDGTTTSYDTTPPPRFEDLGDRESYDTKAPVKIQGDLKTIRLGQVAHGRSGDKGANLNFGLYVQTQAQWNWLRSYMSRAKVQEMMGDDWQTDFSIERVEFPGIFAVHFVVYGILGRGVSSTKRLDGFGKGFIDYFRDKEVEVPVSILDAPISGLQPSRL